MTDLAKNPSYKLGRLEAIVEQAIVDLLSDRDPHRVAVKLGDALGAPVGMDLLDWITERRWGDGSLRKA